jgi:hypothetical protein
MLGYWTETIIDYQWKTMDQFEIITSICHHLHLFPEWPSSYLLVSFPIIDKKL